MKRTIKFRGKRVGTHEWVYGLLFQTPVGEWKIKKGFREYLVKPDTIGQFTGLRDRRGQDVYEGDVVFWIARDMRGKGRGEQGAIFWDKHTMSWAILRDKPTSDGRPCVISRPFDKRHLEVVGNIFDNPELIGKELHDFIFPK